MNMNVWMNTSANPQQQLELQQEGSERDGNGDGDEDAAVDDVEDDALASNDPCSSEDDALLQVPPPDPFQR